MFNEQVIRQAVYLWAKRQVAPVKVIWAGQSEHTPEPPFVSLNLIAPLQRIGHDELTAQTDGRTAIKGNREFTLSINTYGDGAFEIMSKLQNSLEYPTVQERLLAEGAIVYVDAGAVQNLSGLEDSMRRTRGQLDVIFRYTERAVDVDSTYIEQVEIEDETRGETFVVG